MDIYLLRSTALICNIIVAGSGTYVFVREGYLDIKKAIPIIGCSIPLAFIGGFLPLSRSIIFISLGLSLGVAAILLWTKKVQKEKSLIKQSTASAGALGGSIGFLSGVVGIGGGIFLSPILNLINWSSAKKIAGMASFFIVVNSVAGLLGQWLQNPPHAHLMQTWPLFLSVLFGGLLGTRFAAVKFNNMTIRKTTAILIMIASLKILNDHLFHLDIFK